MWLSARNTYTNRATTTHTLHNRAMEEWRTTRREKGQQQQEQHQKVRGNTTENTLRLLTLFVRGWQTNLLGDVDSYNSTMWNEWLPPDQSNSSFTFIDQHFFVYMCLYSFFSSYTLSFKHIRVQYSHVFIMRRTSSPFSHCITTPFRLLAFTSFYLKWRGAAAGGIFVAFCNDFKRRSLSSYLYVLY